MGGFLSPPFGRRRYSQLLHDISLSLSPVLGTEAHFPHDRPVSTALYKTNTASLCPATHGEMKGDWR